MQSPRTTIPAIRESKRRNGAAPLVMITAYDAPGARVVDSAGVDMILVGDSVAMVVLGYDDTLSVTIDDMVHHIGAVARAQPRALIVADMPWMSYHVSIEHTVLNAARLMRAGGQCVKLEGGRKRIPMVESIVNAEIPVMAHIGLTPQSTLAMGGFKVQGRQVEEARKLIDEARGLQEAGCFAILLEGVPNVLGHRITEALDVPVIGIGAGADTDGQVLVYHDVIGLENRIKPKFVRRYAAAYDDQVSAVKRFASDVRAGEFPAIAECYEADEALQKALGA